MSTKAIIIGLGGIGSEIVCELERYLEEEKREHSSVRFVIMDTDVNTIARVKRNHFGGRIVTMSDRMTVGEYLADNKKAQEWFLENSILDWKPVTEGAGQVRAVSRLAFELAIRSNRLQPLYEAIRELHAMSDGSETKSSFRIVIVSTLAGGTGSGVLLPLALYLRKYLFETYKRKDVIIRGMFLMSDCLERVVEDEGERKSLRGNTYAAIKELDAFMKRADGYLPPQYGRVYMENSGLQKTDNYMSYNYCYLFGARDGENSELQSFQELKRYIVQCIDAQLLGPMQELNNSIEDNVLKSTMVNAEKMEKAEFNRYCAAGIRVLKYPYYKILDYLGRQKTLEIFSNQWMEADREYWKEKEEQLVREQNGYVAREISRGDFYVSYVTSGSDRSSMIRQVRSEMYSDDGSGAVGIWVKYIAALEADIQETEEQLRGQWNDELQVCRGCLNGIEKMKEYTRDKLEQLQEAYGNLYDALNEKVGAAMAGFGKKYFEQARPEESLPPSHFMYWLRNSEGLKHLNSVRFFLYQAIQAMETGYERAEAALEREEFVLTGTEELKDMIARLGNFRLFNKFSPDFKTVLRGYKERIAVLESYSVNRMLKRAYMLGLESLKKISGVLEDFYDNYDYNRRMFESAQSIAFDNITKASGRVTQYVKADAEQLKLLSEAVCRDYDRDRKANHELSFIIFQGLWKAAECGREEKRERIGGLFQKDSVNFWKRNLEERYKNELDFSVAEAVLQEGAQRLGNIRRYDYLRDKLEETWNGTAPFLQVNTANGIGQTKNFCTYNPCLFNEDEQAQIVLKEKLEQRGGVAGQEVDKYTIIFYRVTYNLRAEDVREFSLGGLGLADNPVQRFSLRMRDGGMGATMRDYYAIVKMQMKTKLTPHLDWHWGNALAMPDLNPDYTKYLEKRIYQAFYVLWLQKIIKPEAGKEYSCKFSTDSERKKFSSLEAILYRLADSAEDVDRILEEVETELNQAVEQGEEYAQTSFAKSMAERKDPILGLTVELLEEVPQVRWDAGMVRSMLEGIAELVYSVIEAYFPEKKRAEKIKEVFQALEKEDGEARRYCKNIAEDVLREHKWAKAVNTDYL